MQIWNIVAKVTEREARSPEEIFPVLRGHLGIKPIRFLEIGVFEAGLFKRLQRSGLNVQCYVGVDPYLGTVDDAYLGAYWAETEGANRVYHASKAIIEGAGHSLMRQSSGEFFEANYCKWDVIYVDGDHRFLPALRDIDEALRVCADGGLVMVDDYANVTCPEVTAAVNEFCRLNSHNIKRMGYCHAWITPSGSSAPIVQSTVYFEPVASEQRKFGARIEVPESKRERRRSLLDITARQAVGSIWRRVLGRGKCP